MSPADDLAREIGGQYDAMTDAQRDAMFQACFQSYEQFSAALDAMNTAFMGDDPRAFCIVVRVHCIATLLASGAVAAELKPAPGPRPVG